jgi:hypothetical protein
MNEYVWFAVGLVGSFILFGVIPNMRDELDGSARDDGFLSAADQRAAEQTGVTDAATWQRRREQADAAKAAAAEAARKAGAAEAEAEARRLNREDEAKAERDQRADEQLDADEVAKAEAALRANQQATADEAEKARRATEQVDAAKAAEPAERQKGAAAVPCIIRGGKKECLPAKASPKVQRFSGPSNGRRASKFAGRPGFDSPFGRGSRHRTCWERHQSAGALRRHGGCQAGPRAHPAPPHASIGGDARRTLRDSEKLLPV